MTFKVPAVLTIGTRDVVVFLSGALAMAVMWMWLG